MTRLPKEYLLRQLERGLEATGWSILHLSPPAAHPARYRITRGERSSVFTAYVWNITHGGGPRSQSEYRIQITGLTPHQIIPDPEGRTLVLGYWDAEGVFAGFDYEFHAGPLGGSPSFQVGKKALTGAKRTGFSVHKKATGELVVGFRADFAGTYVEHVRSLHAAGQQDKEVDLLTQLSERPESVAATEIETNVGGPRQYAIIQMRKAQRDNSFRERVLDAYSNQCAFCNMQLELLDGAHILPVTEANSTDETSNGVALCTLHHRAYDRGLVTFDTAYQIVVNDLRLVELTNLGRGHGLSRFKREVSGMLWLPSDQRDWPNPAYVEEANQLRRWSL